jgi:DNA-binding beta-propeller fold protein YncE
MSRVLAAVLACAAAAMTACFSPALDGFACGPDRSCPQGYECSASNMCVRPGTGPGQPDAAVPPPDAGDVPGAPTASIVFPLPVGMTEATSIRVRGTASPGVPTTPGGQVAPVRAVRVNGVAAASDNDFADWEVDVPLVLGTNILRVETEDELGTVDPEAASVSIVRTSPLVFVPISIALSPDGGWAAVFDGLTGVLLAVDLATGRRTVITDPQTVTGPPITGLEQLAITSDGVAVIAVDAPRGTLLSIDVATGARTLLSGDGFGTGEGLDFPVGVALDEATGMILVADDGDEGNQRLLAIDPANGRRVVLSGVDSGGGTHGNGPQFGFIEAITIDPVNNRAIVLDSGQHALFAVDLSNGNRSALFLDDPNAAGPALEHPVAMAMPSPDDAFVADLDLGIIVHVDLSNGNRTVVSGGEVGSGVSIFDMSDMAVRTDGQRLLLLDFDHLVPIVVDLASGARSLIEPLSVGSGPEILDPEGIVVDVAGGRVLVSDDGLDAVLAIDVATGDRTLLGNGAAVPLADPEGITMDPASGRAILVESSLDGCVALDLASGAPVVLSSDAVGSGTTMQDPQWAALDEAGTTAFVTDLGRVAVFSVDLVTGARQVLSSNDIASPIGFEVPETLILDQARNRVLVADPAAGTVIAVDLASGQRTAFGAQGTGAELREPLGIAHTADPDTALVYDDASGLYLFLDLVTGDRTSFANAELRARVPLTLPGFFSVDPTRDVIVIPDFELRAVVALDLRTGERLIVSR